MYPIWMSDMLLIFCKDFEDIVTFPAMVLMENQKRANNFMELH